MSHSAPLQSPVPNLPPVVQENLRRFLTAIASDNVLSVTLFGSAAEGRLRPASDVNVVLVLRAFDRAEADRLAPAIRTAQAAIRLAPMILTEAELPAGAAAFAQKFADIRRRRFVLHGADVFAELAVGREDLVRKLRQSLLNLALRLRAEYLERNSQEDRLVLLLGEIAGPLRSCAAALGDLQGKASASPKEALAAFAVAEGRESWIQLAAALSEARERRALAPGAAADAAFAALGVVERMRQLTEDL